jgi:hypothetical protein
MAQHDNGTGTRYESLGQKLEMFINKLNLVTAEIDEIKRQQTELLDFIKSKLK